LDRKPLIDVGEGGLKPPLMEGRVEFQDVRFSYPMRSHRRILKDLNLTVSSGQTVAIVGESGCGKSTLVALLERFYDITSGQLVSKNVCLSVCLFVCLCVCPFVCLNPFSFPEAD
jgi:ABC-type multidrug transport system fused ATPase/permease subunit